MGDPSDTRGRRQAPLPRLVSWLVGHTAAGARWLAGWLVGVGGPTAQRAGVFTAKAGGRALRAGARAAVRRRALLVAVAARVGWCAALWCLAQGWIVLLGLEPLGTDREILSPFVAGIVVAIAVVAVAQERHLRRGAIAIGTANVVAALLAWTALNGTG